MGQSRTSENVRRSFAEPLCELVQAFQETCDQWQRAHRAGCIGQEELYLNTATAERGLGAFASCIARLPGSWRTPSRVCINTPAGNADVRCWVGGHDAQAIALAGRIVNPRRHQADPSHGLRTNGLEPRPAR